MAGYDGVETLIFKVLERVFSRADVDVSVTRDMSIRTTPDDHVLDRKYDLHAASSREEGVRYTKVRCFESLTCRMLCVACAQV